MKAKSAPINTDLSQQYFNKAQHYMPGGVNSPVRAFKAVGLSAPLYIEKGHGPFLFDADGNQFIDYVGSWGPMIAGHAHPSIVKAVQRAAENGLSYGACCKLEIDLAEQICAAMPSIEKIRFVNSGTEATMSALRLARAYTQRNKMIKFSGCYHGHADSFLIEAGSGAMTFNHPSSPGVPASCAQDTLNAHYNDLGSVEKLFQLHPNAIACVIVEPVAANMNLVLPEPNFLKGLRELCDQYGALLIFDEVITGFRVAKGGAQSIYGIHPDMTTLGKIIGGGMPVGAFGGRSEIMNHLAPVSGVYQAGTLSGNPLAMTAGLATLAILDTPHFYESLENITMNLVEGLQNAAHKANAQDVVINAACGLFGIFFSKEPRISHFNQVKACDKHKFTRFFQLMLQAGIYLAPSPFEAGFVSSQHRIEQIGATIDAAYWAFKQL